MPRPLLSNTFRGASTSLARLVSIRSDSVHLPAKYQQFVAEMIMLRLFSVLEKTIAEIAYKICCGAEYINGNVPVLLYRACSIQDARAAMLSRGRARIASELKWTKSKYIADSTKYTIDGHEKFIFFARTHGGMLDEMRKVRNHIAHNNSSTRLNYKQVVRMSYGADVKTPVGVFLTSTKRVPVSKIDEYLVSTRIIINDMVSG